MIATFTTPELCARTGISEKQVDYWRRTGILPTPVGGAKPGSGRRNRWTRGHLLAAAAVRLFSDAVFGHQPNGHEHRVAVARAVYRAHLEGVPFSDRWLVLDAAGVHVDDADALTARARANGGRAWSALRLEEIAEAVR